mgnify:CR=1 FL=1
MYLRCDGVLDISGAIPSCTSWIAVTDTELLSAALATHQLSQEDYTALAGTTIAILLAAVSIVAVLKKLKINR